MGQREERFVISVQRAQLFGSIAALRQHKKQNEPELVSVYLTFLG